MKTDEILLFRVEFCPAFPQAFAIGPWNGNLPSDLAAKIRSTHAITFPVAVQMTHELTQMRPLANWL